jgi:hypothetical protein
MVERCQRRLKDAFRARLAGSDWPLHLPWVLMGLRAAPTEDTGVSAAEIVFGPPLVLPGQILDAEEPLPADFITKLWQSGPLPPSCPLSYGRWRASRRRHCYQLHSCTSARAVKFPLCRRPYKVLPRARRFSGCRWASGRSRSLLTALSRTGGRSCPASTAASKGLAAS